MFRYIRFWVLILLGIGYFPTKISFLILALAILVCPIQPVHRWVDTFLEWYSARMAWITFFVVILGYYPLENFELIGIRAAQFLEAMEQWLCTLLT